MGTVNRKQLIAAIQVAGYHNDAATGTRLLIENCISQQAYIEAYREGQRREAAGVRCTCAQCAAKNQDQPTTTP